MQTQVSNGRTGRPKFVNHRKTASFRTAISEAMKESWKRRRTEKAAEQRMLPQADRLDWANIESRVYPPALTEIDALITARQTELDQLRAVRAMLTTKS